MNTNIFLYQNIWNTLYILPIIKKGERNEDIMRYLLKPAIRLRLESSSTNYLNLELLFRNLIIIFFVKLMID